MPKKPKRPCRMIGCPNLSEDGEIYCPEHKAQTEQFYNRYQRPTDKNVYGRAWLRIRDRKIHESPVCEECLKRGIYRSAEEVHHRVPLSEGGTHERSNLMSLCRSCHMKLHGELGTRKPHSYEE